MNFNFGDYWREPTLSNICLLSLFLCLLIYFILTRRKLLFRYLSLRCKNQKVNEILKVAFHKSDFVKILENWYGIKLRRNSVLLAIISLIFLLVVPPIQDFVRDTPLQLDHRGLVAIGLHVVMGFFIIANLAAYSYIFDLSMGKKQNSH